MNKKFKLVGVPVSGPEENYILTSEQEGPNSLLNITDLLRQVGAKDISWQEATSFEMPENEHFAVYKENYLKLNGRVPRVYNIKINVEVEELTEEECKAFWVAQS